MRRRLGVNIDHIATLRSARGERYPDPCDALPILKACRVDQITLHLREDRRHIQDADLARIVRQTALPVNLEMGVTPEMLRIALKHRPHTVTFVPERRLEITTEGGLNCVAVHKRLAPMIVALRGEGIRVSLFIAADTRQILAAQDLAADAVELHTGDYCHKLEQLGGQASRAHLAVPSVRSALERVRRVAALAASLQLKVFAGHGLHTGNLQPVAKVAQIEEYNIGHALIARAVFVGLKAAIYEIQRILRAGSRG
jgi:pyridoxine 5-phosphate synthase